MKKESYATRMAQALLYSNMTQTELSRKTGIPKSAISQYIAGTFEPKQDRVEIIAKVLDVSEAWLMGYDVPKERNNTASQEFSEQTSGLTERYAAILSTIKKVQYLNTKGILIAEAYIDSLLANPEYNQKDK